MKQFEQWGVALKRPRLEECQPAFGDADRSWLVRRGGHSGFQFVQERLEYNLRTHHSNINTFDHVQRDEVIRQGAVAAVFAWYAANTPAKLPRKAMPAAKPTQ